MKISLLLVLSLFAISSYSQISESSPNPSVQFVSISADSYLNHTVDIMQIIQEIKFQKKQTLDEAKSSLIAGYINGSPLSDVTLSDSDFRKIQAM